MPTINISDLRGGHIVRYTPNARNSALGNSQMKVTYGYVPDVPARVDGADDARVSDFTAYEIIPVIKSNQKVIRDLQNDGISLVTIKDLPSNNMFGLDPNKDYAVVIDPKRVHNREGDLGTHYGKVNIMGDISQSPEEERILTKIHERGGENYLRHKQGEGPSEHYRSPLGGMTVPENGGEERNIPTIDDKGRTVDSASRWEDIKARRAFYAQRAASKKASSSAGSTSRVDLPTQYWHQSIGLELSLQKAFESPAKPLKPIHTLAEAIYLAETAPETFEKYMPYEEVSLEEMKEAGYIEDNAATKRIESDELAAIVGFNIRTVNEAVRICQEAQEELNTLIAEQGAKPSLANAESALLRMPGMTARKANATISEFIDDDGKTVLDDFIDDLAEEGFELNRMEPGEALDKLDAAHKQVIKDWGAHQFAGKHKGVEPLKNPERYRVKEDFGIEIQHRYQRNKKRSSHAFKAGQMAFFMRPIIK